MNPSASKPDRTLIAIVVVIVAVVIVALIAVLARPAPELLDAGTPEGVVQRYSTAVIAGDEAAAAEYLSPAARDRCDVLESPYTDQVRLSLKDTVTRSDTADVNVAIVTTYQEGPFGSSESETQGVFNLVKVDGDWLIDTAPWELTVCPDTKGAL
jgi:hypothetical protein